MYNISLLFQYGVCDRTLLFLGYLRANKANASPPFIQTSKRDRSALKCRVIHCQIAENKHQPHYKENSGLNNVHPPLTHLSIHQKTYVSTEHAHILTLTQSGIVNKTSRSMMCSIALSCLVKACRAESSH